MTTFRITLNEDIWYKQISKGVAFRRGFSFNHKEEYCNTPNEPNVKRTLSRICGDEVDWNCSAPYDWQEI